MKEKILVHGYAARTIFLRSEVNRILSLSMLFSCLLVTARVIYTGRITFLGLVWNMFLAYIPYALTGFGERKPQRIRNRYSFLLFFLLWLLCIPNSFYIMTDLYHLGDYYNDFIAPQWFDLAVILSFAWNGLLLGILSVRQMEKIIQSRTSKFHELIFLYPVMWLSALGVNTGRYLRFNSWDVLADPFQLMRELVEISVHPLAFRSAWGMVFCFSVLMTLMYLTIRRVATAVI